MLNSGAAQKIFVGKGDAGKKIRGMRIIQGDEKYSGRGSLAEKEICVAGGQEIHDNCGDARLFSPDVHRAADVLVDLAVRALEFRHGKCTGVACF